MYYIELLEQGIEKIKYRSTKLKQNPQIVLLYKAFWGFCVLSIELFFYFNSVIT